MLRIKILLPLLLVASIAFGQDAVTVYNEGLALKKEKNSKAALEKFKQASQLRADYTEAFYEMGWCQNDVKDYTGALNSFRKVLPFWTTIPKVYFETGYAFSKLEQYDSAVYYFNNCIRIKPDYSLAFKELAYVAYIKATSDVATMQAFDKYESIETKEITDYLYWYRKGFTQNALGYYASAKISLNKSLLYKQDYINTYLELGFAANKLKLGDEAIDWYKKASAIDPKSHVPYNGIGEVYRDTKKDMDAAISWYNKSLAINSNERKANFGVGYCFNTNGKYAEAIPYFKRAIQSEATYIAAYVELGYSYYMTNDNVLAESNLKKALELNNKNENARYYLGLLYIGQNNKIKAQQMANELKDLNSKNAAQLQAKVNLL